MGYAFATEATSQMGYAFASEATHVFAPRDSWDSLGLRCRNGDCDALQLASDCDALLFPIDFCIVWSRKKRAKNEPRSGYVFRAPGVRKRDGRSICAGHLVSAFLGSQKRARIGVRKCCSLSKQQISKYFQFRALTNIKL